MEVSENFLRPRRLIWPQRQRGVDRRIGPASGCRYRTVHDQRTETIRAPRLDTGTKRRHLPALAYYSGVLEPAFTSKFMKVFVPRGDSGLARFRRGDDFRQRAHRSTAYIAGETFTAADVLYAGAFALFMGLALAGREEDQSTRGLRGALRLATGPRTGCGKGSESCLNRARKRWAILGAAVPVSCKRAILARTRTRSQRSLRLPTAPSRAVCAIEPARPPRNRSVGALNLSTHTAAAKLTLRHSLAESQLFAHSRHSLRPSSLRRLSTAEIRTRTSPQNLRDFPRPEIARVFHVSSAEQWSRQSVSRV